MANMSYCRFENTYKDLIDCLEHIHDKAPNDRDEGYRKKLIDLLTDEDTYGYTGFEL
jgi:hypothetical protein